MRVERAEHDLGVGGVRSQMREVDVVEAPALRRPGEQVRWSVALGEIVDEGAAPPQPNTLLWYRLACTLPAQLPGDVLSEATPDEARAIQADYRVVTNGLGRCARSRVPSR